MTNTDWNGLSELLEIGWKEGLAVEVPRVLDLSQLKPEDGVLLIGKQDRENAQGFSEFMRDGGRVALAQDDPTPQDLLQSYDIRVGSPRLRHTPTINGNPSFPVARPHLDHVLSEGVDMLVTNHSWVLEHEHLSPLFQFEGAKHGVVLVGAVGNGRVIAISDASIFINNMLLFEPNRRFATNLLHYLHGKRGGTLYVLGAEGSVNGSYPSHGSFLVSSSRVSRWLQSAAHAETPPIALQVGALLLCTLFALITVATLVRRRVYVPSFLRVGVERSESKRETNLKRREELAFYRNAFLSKVAMNLHLPPGSNPVEIAARLSTVSSPHSKAVLTFFRDLGSVLDNDESLISEHRAMKLVEQGEALLSQMAAMNPDVTFAYGSP